MASVSMMILVLIYTNLKPIPFAWLLLLNILFMITMMSRMTPAMALTSALPKAHDRGAYMSINASLQQIAGGFAAIVGGMIVVQPSKSSPLQHYPILGLVVVGLSLVSVLMIWRVKKCCRRLHNYGC